MEQCPGCRSRKIHRSRVRGPLERLRRAVTGKRPFRCSDCGWRGWGVDLGLPENPDAHQSAGSVGADGPEPDLAALDEGLKRAGDHDHDATKH